MDSHANTEDHMEARRNEREYIEQYRGTGVNFLLATYFVVFFAYGGFWLSGYLTISVEFYHFMGVPRLCASGLLCFVLLFTSLFSLTKAL